MHRYRKKKKNKNCAACYKAFQHTALQSLHARIVSLLYYFCYTDFLDLVISSTLRKKEQMSLTSLITVLQLRIHYLSKSLVSVLKNFHSNFRSHAKHINFIDKMPSVYHTSCIIVSLSIAIRFSLVHLTLYVQSLQNSITVSG